MVLHYDRDHDGRLFRARDAAAQCRRYLAANRGWGFRAQRVHRDDAWPTLLTYRDLAPAERQWRAPAGVYVYAWERPGETCRQLALWTACGAAAPEADRATALAARAQAEQSLLQLPTALNSKSRLLWAWAPDLSPAAVLQGRYAHLVPGPRRPRPSASAPSVSPVAPAVPAVPGRETPQKLQGRERYRGTTPVPTPLRGGGVRSRRPAREFCQRLGSSSPKRPMLVRIRHSLGPHGPPSDPPGPTTLPLRPCHSSMLLPTGARCSGSP